MRTLLISDSNILMDVEACGLGPAFFGLAYAFAVPDILFEEELSSQFGHFLNMGLEIRELSPEVVGIAERLSVKFRKVSGNDRFALALAIGEGVGLLTGDQLLRLAAEEERVPVHGTVWLLQQMLREGSISRETALHSLELMRDKGRRLPWEQARRYLSGPDTGPE